MNAMKDPLSSEWMADFIPECRECGEELYSPLETLCAACRAEAPNDVWQEMDEALHEDGYDLNPEE